MGKGGISSDDENASEKARSQARGPRTDQSNRGREERDRNALTQPRGGRDRLDGVLSTARRGSRRDREREGVPPLLGRAPEVEVVATSDLGQA